MVELSQLGSEKYSTCRLDDLPEPIECHSAIRTDIGLLYCGGYTNSGFSNNCFRLASNGSWIRYSPLQKARSCFSMTHINTSLIAIGGQSHTYGVIRHTSTKSYERIEFNQENQWKKGNLPFAIEDHCSVSINSTVVMIIGGEDYNLVSILSNDNLNRMVIKV